MSIVYLQILRNMLYRGSEVSLSSFSGIFMSINASSHGKGQKESRALCVKVCVASCNSSATTSFIHYCNLLGVCDFVSVVGCR